jgi:hypothetical protein
MPIDWPSSPSTGQLYTSNNNTWRWNGYAWDVTTLQSSGRYQAEWVIFDPVNLPRSYPTLNNALIGANSGDTIYLTESTTEGYGLSTGLTLKNGVNINLNGNTFKYSFGTTAQTEGLRTDTVGPTKAKIQNGTIEFIGATSVNRMGIRTNSNLDEFDFTGLTVILNAGRAALFCTGGSVDGGSFHNLSTNPFAYGAWYTLGRANWTWFTDYPPSYFRNVEGYSAGGAGVLLNSLLSNRS